MSVDASREAEEGWERCFDRSVLGLPFFLFLFEVLRLVSGMRWMDGWRVGGREMVVVVCMCVMGAKKKAVHSTYRERGREQDDL